MPALRPSVLIMIVVSSGFHEPILVRRPGHRVLIGPTSRADRSPPLWEARSDCRDRPSRPWCHRKEEERSGRWHLQRLFNVRGGSVRSFRC